MAQCNDFHHVNKSDRCDFISTTESCEENDGLIHYMLFPYCILPDATPLADIILFLWIGYLFVCLAITAEDYFCPALTTISKMLRLSQNVAGVTFLALGNGSPDIFSCIVALGSGNLETAFLAFGAMFGAGLFVNTVVVGSVTISQNSYTLARRPFFRDCIFYLSAIYWTWYNCYNGKIVLATGIGYIALYAFYVFLVIIGRIVFQRFLKKKTGDGPAANIHTDVDTGYAANENQQEFVRDRNETIAFNDSDAEQDAYRGDDPDGFTVNEDQWTEVPGIKSHAFTRALAVAQTLPNMVQNSGYQPVNFGPINDADDTPLLRHDMSLNNPLQRQSSNYAYPSYSVGAIKQIMNNFFLGLNPLHLEDWDEYSIKDKIFDVISVPANIFFCLTIPVVDTSAPLLGWNKLLNALQLVTCPVVACLLLQLTTINVMSVPVPIIAVSVGFLLCILVLLTSSQGENPIYYKSIYTCIGFIMSIVWIYTIANEIVSLLTAFGHIFLLNGAILGLTVLSWANSVGDLVSDVAMAKQGYPQMAVSACIGGPCLNMLLGIGLASTLSILRSGKNIELKLSGSLIISSAFLMLTICSHIVAVPLMKFNVRKWYGYYLFSLYALFLILALLNITGVFSLG